LLKKNKKRTLKPLPLKFFKMGIWDAYFKAKESKKYVSKMLLFLKKITKKNF
jgi:hypothetical protein